MEFMFENRVINLSRHINLLIEISSYFQLVKKSPFESIKTVYFDQFVQLSIFQIKILLKTHPIISKNVSPTPHTTNTILKLREGLKESTYIEIKKIIMNIEIYMMCNFTHT